MKDLIIGGKKFTSRFFLGTGKFASGEMLKRALAACGTELVTTALTRVHEGDAEHDDILGVIDRSKVEVMLNTSGARNAAEAVRIAKLGKAAGYNWIKIEVHPDARYLLPNAAESKIVVTMNVRELRHFFALRMCSRAQWEIREMARQMHLLCLKTAPTLFADAGPACLRGQCAEGEKSCGRMKEIREERAHLLEEINKGE